MRRTLVDRFVAYLSPEAGVKRARARMVEEMIIGRLASRKYDGAAVGRRTSGWNPLNTSANAEIRGQLGRLRDRSRDLVRNNPYAARAVETIVANTIGAGIIPQVKDSSRARAQRFQDAWVRWAETTECDLNGQHDIYGLQSLAMRTLAESGEVIIRRVFVKGKTLPIKIQILEPDHIDSTRESFGADKPIIQGVEVSDDGAPQALWLYENHPGDYGLTGSFNSLKSKRFALDGMIHLYDVKRPGQLRGVPWGAPVMLKMQDLEEFIDATIVKQKVAASFAAFVEDPDGALTDGDGKAISISEKIEPGAIEILPPGKRMSFPNPPATNDFGGFTQEVLHAIAIGFGVPYESLTGDYSRVNFSSGRMGWIEFQRNIDRWRWNLVIPRFCDPIFSWFTEAALISGVDHVAPKGVTWTPPRREMIDPSKEFSSMATAVRSGFMSLSEALRSQGFDPDEVYGEIAQDNEKLDKLKLILDTDPRKTMKAGAIQAPPPDDQDDPEDEADDDEGDASRYFTDESGHLYRKNRDGSIEKV